MKPVFNKSDYSWKTPIQNIRVFFRQIKWSFQRIKKGYSDWDCGDIDVWFYNVFPDMLKELRESNQRSNYSGFPAFLEYEYYSEHKEEMGMSYEEFVCSPNSERIAELRKKCDDACKKCWLGVLSEMELLFRESDEDQCSKGFKAHEYQEECRKKAFEMLDKWFPYLWE